jgi:Na+/melibiose symporter-like transporter
MAMRHLENTPDEAGMTFDWSGALVLSTLLICFMYGLTQLGKDSSGKRTVDVAASLFSTAVWPYLVVGILLVVPFLWLESRASNPIVSVRILNNRQLLIGYLLSVISGATMGTLIFIPQASHYILGTDTAMSGIMVIPMALTTVFATPASGIMLDKFGSRFVLTVGSAISALSCGLFTFWVNEVYSFIIALVIMGIGFGMIIGSPIRYIIIGEVGEKDRAPAISASSVFQQTGTLLGTSIMGGIFAASAIVLNKTYGKTDLELPLEILKPAMQPAVQQGFGVIMVCLIISCICSRFFLKSQAEEKDRQVAANPVQSKVVSQ